MAACTGLRGSDAESASSDPGRLTRAIAAKELRKHYRFPDAGAHDARVPAPDPSSQAGTRAEPSAEPPPVTAADAALTPVDAASAAGDAASTTDAATAPLMPDAATSEPPPEPPPDPPPEPPPDPQPDPPPPMCLPATAYCDATAQCCGALQCGQTTLGQVCCGLQREPCSRSNGEDCCGKLSCDRTTLGTVCCGERGAPCATRNGEDCCRELECIAGRCQ